MQITWRGKTYLVDLDTNGKTSRIRVHYVRKHRNHSLGLIRTIYPLKTKEPSVVITEVSQQAENRWLSTQTQ